MKRLILALVVVVAMMAVLAAPIFADTTVTSQNWKLDSIKSSILPAVIPTGVVPPVYIMEKTPYYTAQTGSVSIPASSSVMWLANGSPTTPVSFPYGRWDIDLMIDLNYSTYLLEGWYPGATPQNIQVGDYDPATQVFTPFDMAFFFAAANPTPWPVMEVTDIQFESSVGATVSAGHYLALLLKNTDTLSAHTVYCDLQPDKSHYPSCITSPQYSETYPTPELAAGALLGAGLLGLGGFVLLRRQHSETTL